MTEPDTGRYWIARRECAPLSRQEAEQAADEEGGQEEHLLLREVSWDEPDHG